MSCIFCDFANGLLDAKQIVYEDNDVLAFIEKKHPQAPFHLLLIPKIHIESAADIDEDNNIIIARIFLVAAKIAKESKLDHFKMNTNSGKKADQTVPHLHFHMLSNAVLNS